MEHLDPGLAPDARPPRIQDVDEILRWIAAGRSTSWMCEEYERRYNITAPPSLFVDVRQGLGPSATRDATALIPWSVRAEHRWAYPLALLRMEQRRRSGHAITSTDRARLESWRGTLERKALVVHYDPTTAEGFHYVARRPGIDDDLVRRPHVDGERAG